MGFWELLAQAHSGQIHGPENEQSDQRPAVPLRSTLMTLDCSFTSWLRIIRVRLRTPASECDGGRPATKSRLANGEGRQFPQLRGLWGCMQTWSGRKAASKHAVVDTSAEPRRCIHK